MILRHNGIDPASDAQPTHVLEGNITGLYGDFRDKNQIRAMMGIEFFLLDASSASKVVFRKAYQVASPVKTQAVSDLVAAYNECLANILTELEGDMLKALQGTE